MRVEVTEMWAQDPTKRKVECQQVLLMTTPVAHEASSQASVTQ